MFIAKIPLNDEVKNEIRKLYIGKIRKPSRVLVSLRATHQEQAIYDQEPSRNQILNALKNLRKEFNVDGEISLKDLEDHLTSRCKVPESRDEAFVIGKEFIYAAEDENTDDESEDELTAETSNESNKRSFWFMMSTRRLLSLAAECDLICADSTFKFVWLGFPAILIGTVDLQKQFHPLAFGITSIENTDVYAGVFKVKILLNICDLFSKLRSLISGFA